MLQPYHGVSILKQTLDLDSSKIFTDTVLLVLSTLLAHLLTKARLHPFSSLLLSRSEEGHFSSAHSQFLASY